MDTPNPTPSRKKVDPRDWESYVRVCKEEGVAPCDIDLAGPANVRGSGDRHPESQAGAETAEEKGSNKADDQEARLMPKIHKAEIEPAYRLTVTECEGGWKPEVLYKPAGAKLQHGDDGDLPVEASLEAAKKAACALVAKTSGSPNEIDPNSLEWS